ncbi:hypothetical protein [Amycolatopsis sp. cmx-8-4]|uniref:hypothetical protein n=1 Tax=Amycolatopsis sp. cmx-8-4 TaxID=2790947 RepID=UPI0039789609
MDKWANLRAGYIERMAEVGKEISTLEGIKRTGQDDQDLEEARDMLAHLTQNYAKIDDLER